MNTWANEALGAIAIVVMVLAANEVWKMFRDAMIAIADKQLSTRREPMKAMKVVSILVGILAAAFIFGAGIKVGAGSHVAPWVTFLWGACRPGINAAIGIALATMATAMWYAPAEN